MKIDQVIDLILDEDMCSESDSENDENMPINQNQLKQPALLQNLTKCNKQNQLSLHEQLVTTSDDEDDIPLSKLVTAKKTVLKVLNKATSNEATKMPLSNISLNVDISKARKPQLQDSSSDDEDDIPLGILLARKSLQSKPFACKPITPTRKIRKLNSLLKGIYDVWTECESSDEDEQSITTTTSTTNINKQKPAETLRSELYSPVISLEKSTGKYILSLKNSKRKIFFK
jgi:hypothetical protein